MELPAKYRDFVCTAQWTFEITLSASQPDMFYHRNGPDMIGCHCYDYDLCGSWRYIRDMLIVTL